MRTLSIIWFLLLFIPIISCTSKSGNNPSLKKGSTDSGKVISIIDGDTYDVLLQGKKTVRVRMEGIDAPEKGMPFYQKSKKYLSDLCFGKQIKIKITGVDNHERFLAYSFLEDGKELSQEMIKAGLAWHFKKYNSDSTLSNLEIKAKNMKKGLWSENNPMSPWTNRSLHRQGISTKDSFNIVENNR
ncbi:Staphylococcal nuclease-like protein [anaerobic digester metagenome]